MRIIFGLPKKLYLRDERFNYPMFTCYSEETPVEAMLFP